MTHVYDLILTYKYAILFPVAIVEGPIVMIIGGFLASIGVLNVYVVYGIGVLGNLIGDTIYYSIGRLGRHRFIAKYGKYIGLTEERVLAVEEHYKHHLLKTILLSKIVNAGIEVFLVSAGLAKVNFKKFISLVFLIEIPKVAIIVAFGYFFGASYVAINGYFHNISIALLCVAAVAALLYFAGRRFIKRPTI